MAIYRFGVRGKAVREIQERLHALGIYRGTIDGAYGPATAAAVEAFQRRHGLQIDGAVGAVTWEALFGADKQASLLARQLASRCLALTGSFETGAGFPDCFATVSGDFDGQGMSFGACQWNFGQGTLQVLLREMIRRHSTIVRSIFGKHIDELQLALDSGKDTLMKFAAKLQDADSHAVIEPWRGMFTALGRTRECQTIQQRAARAMYRAALARCAEYGLWSQRAKALLFDIEVQNGGIGNAVHAQIITDFKRLPVGLRRQARELEMLIIVANRRAEAVKPRWVEDVRKRKLCIATGNGVVHGIRYDLKQMFGIALRK